MPPLLEKRGISLPGPCNFMGILCPIWLAAGGMARRPRVRVRPRSAKISGRLEKKTLSIHSSAQSRILGLSSQSPPMGIVKCLALGPLPLYPILTLPHFSFRLKVLLPPLPMSPKVVVNVNPGETIRSLVSFFMPSSPFLGR